MDPATTQRPQRFLRRRVRVETVVARVVAQATKALTYPHAGEFPEEVLVGRGGREVVTAQEGALQEPARAPQGGVRLPEDPDELLEDLGPALLLEGESYTGLVDEDWESDEPGVDAGHGS